MSNSSIFQIKPHPDFSWSLSRHALLEECPRAYYYNYYGAHNGWLRDAPIERKMTYALKNITNIYLLIGSLIHARAQDVVNSIVNSGRLPSLNSLIKTTKDELRKALYDTRNKDLFYRSPKHRYMLHEYYYGDGISEEKGAQIVERMETCLKNLIDSDIIKELMKTDKDQIKVVDKLDYITINSVKIYCAPDLVLLNPNTCRIIDWKTGGRPEDEESPDKTQVSVYAFYSQEKFQLPKDFEIKANLVYLESAISSEIVIKSQDIENVKSLITESITNMQSYLEDKELNKAKDIEYFTRVNDTDVCGVCNFLEICKNPASLI